MGSKGIWKVIFTLSITGLILFGFYLFSEMGDAISTPEIAIPADGDNQSGQTTSDTTTLPIPAILEDENPDPNIAEFYLNAQKSSKEFFAGSKTNTFGYNGDYLGPTIRVSNGEKVTIKVRNDLDEPTTVHWHGLEVPGEMDGGPHQEVYPGQVWEPNFTINQPAATLWYHPHLLHKTGEQVFKGLAGLFIIDDDNSDNLAIPNDYGKNDIPLVVQDRRFTRDKQFDYDIGMRDMMTGILGDTILVNGAIQPNLDITEAKIRFRLLNGSNARIYNFHLNNNDSFLQIGSDGGLLVSPVELTQLELSPGERAELIVDFSKYTIGDQIKLRSDDFDVMSFKIKALDKDTTIPKKLVSIDRIPEQQATVKRRFDFQGMGPMVNINGKQFNIERIDEKLELNATEIWEITNSASGMGGMGRMGNVAHPFHAHGVQFQILERNGQEPPLNERGWKDTILIHPGDKVIAIAQFKYHGIFMYHCHILEHEDAGMMGQFQVGKGK